MLYKMPSLLQVTIAIVLQALLLNSALINAQTTWAPSMLNGPLCAMGSNGLNNTMFGYSVAISDGVTDGGYTYLAVGRPYDSSVFIYKSKTPEKTDPYLYAGLNGSSYTFTPPSYNPANWILVQYIRDTFNVSTRLFQSQFGYSVSLSNDASLLAVGIPSRWLFMQTSSTLSSLDMNPLNGAVRTFIKGGWNASLSGSVSSQNTTANTTTLSLTPANYKSFYTTIAPIDNLNFTSNAEFTTVSSSACYLTFNNSAVNASVISAQNLTNGTDYYCNYTATSQAINLQTVANVSKLMLSGVCTSDWPTASTTYKLVNSSCTMTFAFNAPQTVVYFPGTTSFVAVCAGSTTSCTKTMFNGLKFPGGIGGLTVTVNVTLNEAFLPLNTSARLDPKSPYDMTYYSTPMAYEKHGSKVAFSKDANASFLFVSANHGWEGIDTNNVVLTNTNVARQGVFVYSRNSSNPRDFSQFAFIHCESPSPLGNLGIDFSVFGSNLQELGIVIRDYYPVDWSKQPSARATVYRFNGTAFYKVTALNNQGYSSSSWKTEDWFGRGLSSVVLPQKDLVLINVGAPRLSQTDYIYHANYSTLYNVTNNINMSIYNTSGFTTVSRPAPVAPMTPFELGEFISNPNYRLRSTFFGGTSSFTPNGEFLIIADSSNANGKGRVYVYRNYNSTLKTFGLSSNILNPEFYANGRYSYGFVVELQKPSTAPETTDSYNTDWYGMSIATNWWTIVTSATINSCVFTYPVPQLYVDPDIYFVASSASSANLTKNDTADAAPVCNGTIYDYQDPTNSSQINTYCCPASYNIYTFNNVTYCTNVTLNWNQTNSTSPNSVSASTGLSTEQQKNAATYSIVGGVVAAICVIPATWLIIREIHKRHYQKKLENELCNAMDLNRAPPINASQTIGSADSNLMHAMFSTQELA